MQGHSTDMPKALSKRQLFDQIWRKELLVTCCGVVPDVLFAMYVAFSFVFVFQG